MVAGLGGFAAIGGNEGVGQFCSGGGGRGGSGGFDFGIFGRSPAFTLIMLAGLFFFVFINFE